MKKLLIVCLMLMVGCTTTSSNEIETKNGKKGFAIECSGYSMWCNVAAVDACPYGFIVLTRDTQHQKLVIECIEQSKQ